MSRARLTLPIAHAVLERHQGVAHLQRFLESGLTRDDVGHLRHLGCLLRPRIGWYADPRLPLDAIRAVRVGGVLGCVSALAAWGIAVPERSQERLHVGLVPGVSRLRHSVTGRPVAAGDEPDVQWHWEAGADEVEGWRVSPVDALLQAAACVEFRWLVAAIDSARCSAQRPALLADQDLPRLRSLLPEHLRAAVDRSDPRSETSGETFVRLELEDRRVPFVPQHPLTTGYRSDGMVDGWLPVEVDGMGTHAGREAGERDRERDGTVAQFGTPPLRFSQTKAVRDTVWVGDVIETVWRRGPRGSADPARHAVHR